MIPNDVAKLLDTAGSTIRLWSGVYAAYLSPSGAAGGGQQRDFTRDDVRVLYFVKRQKEAGRHTPQILEALARMDGNDLATLPLPDERREASVAVVPQSTLDESHITLRLQNSLLTQQIDDLKAQLANEQQVHLRDNERLLRELADARVAQQENETLLKLYESGRLKPPGA